MTNWSYKKFVSVFFLMVLVAAGGYFIWSRFFKYDISKVYKEQEEKYVAAMKSDTYGGKTPKETLDLFVAALRAGDAELASKYFLINDNATREEWVEYLTAVQKKDLLGEMANDIAQSARPLGSSYEDNFAFGLLGSDGTVAVSIRMRLNTYTGVWKIEGLF